MKTGSNCGCLVCHLEKSLAAELRAETASHEYAYLAASSSPLLRFPTALDLIRELEDVVCRARRLRLMLRQTHCFVKTFFPRCQAFRDVQVPWRGIPHEQQTMSSETSLEHRDGRKVLGMRLNEEIERQDRY